MLLGLKQGKGLGPSSLEISEPIVLDNVKRKFSAVTLLPGCVIT